MSKKILTAKEKKEPVMVTIGRLRTRVRDYNKDERGLALLDKITKEVEEMQIELDHLTRDTSNQKGDFVG